MTGRVDQFDDKKGWGHIVTDDNQRLFVHYTEIRSRDKRKTLDRGARVQCEMEANGEKGFKAVNVRQTEPPR